MQRVVGELEAALEPMMLRRHILWTRCRLCPAWFIDEERGDVVK